MILGVLLVSCDKKKTSITQAPIIIVDTILEIPDRIEIKLDLHYNTTISRWTINDSLYSGYIINNYPDGTLKEKFGVLKGKKQNQDIHWYPDGHEKRIAYYHNGKLHGSKKTWSFDSLHTLVSHLNYNSGKPHGLQKKWYPTGEVFKIMNLNMGKEEGLQQAFRLNGDLYANYEARAGRIFGLKKSALCFGIENEIVQYEN